MMQLQQHLVQGRCLGSFLIDSDPKSKLDQVRLSKDCFFKQTGTCSNYN